MKLVSLRMIKANPSNAGNDIETFIYLYPCGGSDLLEDHLLHGQII